MLTIIYADVIIVITEKGVIFMVMEELNTLKKKLEDQVLNDVSYEKIYETSTKIDTLLVEYYKNVQNIKKDSLDNRIKKDLSY